MLYRSREINKLLEKQHKSLIGEKTLGFLGFIEEGLRGHQSEFQEIKEDETMEEGQKKGEDPIEHDPIKNYARRPRTKPTNKLRLGFKAKPNPKLKEPCH